MPGCGRDHVRIGVGRKPSEGFPGCPFGELNGPVGWVPLDFDLVFCFFYVIFVRSFSGFLWRREGLALGHGDSSSEPRRDGVRYRTMSWNKYLGFSSEHSRSRDRDSWNILHGTIAARSCFFQLSLIPFSFYCWWNPRTTMRLLIDRTTTGHSFHS